MNDQLRTEIEQLSADYAACAKMLTAIGDETRQHLILEMMKIGDCSGVRVGEITEKTNLSRPAVSHHLQIMKDAGIVKVRREGTKNYCYFDPEMSALERLAEALRLTIAVSKALPDRSSADGSMQMDKMGKMNQISVYLFHTGQVRVDRAIPLHERNPLAAGRRNKMILPVSAYFIAHPVGNLLIDTGWDTKYAHERPKQLLAGWIGSALRSSGKTRESTASSDRSDCLRRSLIMCLSATWISTTQAVCGWCGRHGRYARRRKNGTHAASSVCVM